MELVDHLVPYWCIRKGDPLLARTMNYVGPGCLRIRLSLYDRDNAKQTGYRRAWLQINDCRRRDEVTLPASPSSYWQNPWLLFDPQEPATIFRRGPWARAAPLNQIRGLSEEVGRHVLHTLSAQRQQQAGHFPRAVPPSTVGTVGASIVFEQIDPQRVVNLMLMVMKQVAPWANPNRGNIGIAAAADLSQLRIEGIGRPFA